MRVSIGVSNAKQLDLNVENPEAVIEDYQKAIDEGQRLLWVKEKDGVRHAIVAETIAYFELEAESTKQVGFGVA